MEDSIYKTPNTLLGQEAPQLDFNEIMSDKKNHVLGRRWVATFIDFAVLASFLLAPDYFLGNTVYQKTMFIWLALLVLYFPILEAFTGYSVGKFICRVKVIDRNGNNPGILKSVIRTLLRIIEVNPFLAGGIPAGLIVFFSKKGQRLGDMAAGTYVAQVNLIQKYNK
ncbi:MULTISPECIES: RDD family protein [Gammaproteobacteria]|uniref:RDD family protein n=1 Tax=Gammaproteobacteria TaxID=1236 RepID=UPI003A952C7A